jgi:hypothetical protein
LCLCADDVAMKEELMTNGVSERTRGSGSA